MRRKDKEIATLHDIETIIRRAQVCRLGLCDNGRPYVVPMCFGYHNRTFYFHAALEGMKLDILRRNNRVCVECDNDIVVVQGKSACDWSMKFRSVIGFGKAVMILSDIDEKKAALQIVMQQYAGIDTFEFSEISLDKTSVIRVDIEQITGKMAGYDNVFQEND